jgi:telomerase protein component 1
MLLRLCREVSDRFSLEYDEEGLDEYQAVKELFISMLARAGEAARKEMTHVLIIIDAINQLSSYNGAWSLDWLPTFMPQGVRCMLTTVSDVEVALAVSRRDPKPPQMEIPPLTQGEKETIVQQQLSEYRKKLTREQLRLLLDKKESSKPLFLLTACEELRLQAQYGSAGQGVDDKIRELPGEVPALLVSCADGRPASAAELS